MPLEHQEVGPVTVERFASNQPHRGKVLAAIQAHADDIPFFCAGTVAKLIAEGYTGYLIQTTNDEKCGPTPSLGDTILRNEREVDELARVLGLRKVINLGYRNHLLDEAAPLELRVRLIYLIRALRIDTVLTFNPWGHNEENPDHYVTAQAVEAAAWMAGMDKDYPEQLACGLQPHSVRERYYWVFRPGQPCNRVVDISGHLEAKVASMSVNKTQGPAGASGRRLRAHLASQGLRLPELDGTEEEADRSYLRRFGLETERAVGAQYGVEYGERFYYVGPGGPFEQFGTAELVDRYVKAHAVPLTKP
ncbi:MAG: PIG-L deacetylase family protein [Candidatus Latescibacterota bacterium]|jgi:LmbE family N-acetylglucosaminyl deacetylase